MYGLTVHYKSPSTEYTSLRLFSTLSSRRAHIFFLWMFKWLKWNAFRRQINVCRPKEHISSNHDRWLNSFNIKQFHKINFYVVERTILQTCSGPIEFLHVFAMLLNSYRFFFFSKAMKYQTNAFKSAPWWTHFYLRISKAQKWEQCIIRRTVRARAPLFCAVWCHCCCKLKYIFYKIPHSTFYWRRHFMWSI